MPATVTYSRQEAVRLVGLRLLADGRPTREVVAATGAGASTVRAWRARLARFDGDPEAAARDAPRCGAPTKLTAEQCVELVRQLEAGPEAAGFEGTLWTLPRVRQLIRDRFGVEYHVDHLGRLLARLGFSPQKPALRARERDDQAVERFRRETWPGLVKKGG